MIRSILFVPAIRPDRFQKAFDTVADAVCIDLEDSVPPERKAEARAKIASQPREMGHGPKRCLRINALSAAEGILDLAMLSSAEFKPDIVILSKVSSPVEVAIARASLGHDTAILALIETVAGLESVEDIAAHEATGALIFGSADFSAEIGSNMNWDALLYARSRIVAAASGAAKYALDGVWLDFRDDQGLLADTLRLKGLGFDGRLAIHPRQIEGIHAALAPTQDELAEARNRVTAFEAAKGKAIQVDGAMVDQPVYEAAMAVLLRGQTK